MDLAPLLAPERHAALAAEFGLAPDEAARVPAILGRLPTLAELGIFSVVCRELC